MADERMPSAHPDPLLDRLRPYLTDTVAALIAAGYHVQGSWLDPRNPRDATIRLDGGTALVWDEEAGWRRGLFLGGAPGLRTRLDRVAWLGAEVLPDPRAVAHLAAHDRERRFRSCQDLCDGFDDHLRTRHG
ncbi:hypothetical protein GCM10010168_55850 [Actinoplanes ianthinogenes]|uniref:DUF6292 domain-containing protein n=1 Tax=Actinoplanes ianthinogenes TaxID=122358 RepID=A0ABM7LQ96_9ACTN|nr:DUF6292 family protein [Actinoplanes ianthinogenes]BCJ41416.1 hypothetical protein Aiant_20730 [Actinoplanes ianthinogenes]GGR30275.1 hypothetical protein GCM10010168_55850 [Actinoplanes ianthinogenes]